MFRHFYLLGLIVILSAPLNNPAKAGEVDVINATVKSLGHDRFSFSATLKHNDSGWEHYANAWRVVDPNGNVLGVRELLHPHVDEQPFTRSLNSVLIPKGIKQVTIEAEDSQHGQGGKVFKLDLPGR